MTPEETAFRLAFWVEAEEEWCRCPECGALWVLNVTRSDKSCPLCEEEQERDLLYHLRPEHRS